MRLLAGARGRDGSDLVHGYGVFGPRTDRMHRGSSRGRRNVRWMRSATKAPYQQNQTPASSSKDGLTPRWPVSDCARRTHPRSPPGLPSAIGGNIGDVPGRRWRSLAPHSLRRLSLRPPRRPLRSAPPGPVGPLSADRRAASCRLLHSSNDRHASRTGVRATVERRHCMRHGCSGTLAFPAAQGPGFGRMSQVRHVAGQGQRAPITLLRDPAGVCRARG